MQFNARPCRTRRGRRPACRPGGQPRVISALRGWRGPMGEPWVPPSRNDHGPPPGTRDRPSDTGRAARLAARPALPILRVSTTVVQSLQGAQVLLLLPLRDLDPVLVPLAPLELDVAREDVVPERGLHQLGAGERLDGLAERARQRDDPAFMPFRL